MTTKNIVSDYSAVADGQWSKQAFTITQGTKLLHSPVPLWGAGDLHASIVVGNAGGSGPQGGAPLFSVIDTVTDSQNVILHDNAIMTLPLVDASRTNFIVSWGTNNAMAFDTFRKDVLIAGLTATLTIPAGIYLVSGLNGRLFGEDAITDAGVKNITVNGTGATICGGTFALGGGQTYQVSGHDARTASVSAGSTSVTCLTHAQASRFTVGQWAIMTGISLQYGGWPSNHFYQDFVLISGVDAGTGVVSFATTPLVNSYLSTWPDILPGSLVLDYGGPAMLMALNQAFDHTEVLNGLTLVHDAQFSFAGLNSTWNSVVVKGDFGAYPTMCRDWALNNCTCTNGTMEIDKYLARGTVTGCSWAGIANQSANLDLTLDTTTITNSLDGTARRTSVRNCTIGSLNPGPIYGRADSLTAINGTISGFGGANHDSGENIAGGNGSSNGCDVDFTMSNGVITVPASFLASALVSKWMIPGTNMFFLGSVNQVTVGGFQILSVSQAGAGADILVTTNWPGGFPTISGEHVWMKINRAASCTFRGVTGCPETVDLSGAPTGAPLYSYTKRTYTGDVATAPYWPLHGKIKYIKVTVDTAYTGATGTVQATLNFFARKPSDFTAASFAPVINLKSTGTRLFDFANHALNWTTTGSPSGDTLPTMTEQLWSGGGYRMTMTDITGEVDHAKWPSFTIEIKTDQGILSRSFECNFV